MFLCLSSIDRTHFDVILFNNEIRKENEQKEADSVLTAVDNFLHEQNVLKDDIEGIFVVVSNGTFSTVRGGTVLANSWSLVKNIPVMGITEDQKVHLEDLIPQLLEKDGYVLPQYNGEPNIRMKKSDS